MVRNKEVVDKKAGADGGDGAVYLHSSEHFFTCKTPGIMFFIVFTKTKYYVLI
jgi:hypothetical protein